MLEPVSKRSLASEVFEQLRDHIVGGALVPGDALPAERILADKLGVNRSAVREGLKRLEQAGLVTIQQGGATRVRNFRRTAGLEILAAMIVRRDGFVDTAVARGLLEMRTELAPVVARLATERRDEDDLEALATVVAEMQASRDDVAALQRHALGYWAAMVGATKNLALQLAFNSLEDTYSGVLDQLTQILASEVGAVDDYAALAEAVRAGRTKKACTTATRIVRRGADSVEAVLSAVELAQGSGG